MSEQHPSPAGDPDLDRPAEGRTSTNQPKTEPAGEGNVSPGTGSYGTETGVGTNQPDRGAMPGAGRATGEEAESGAGGDAPGLGEAYRQPQRYGASPDPIGTDDVAGARATTPGGAPGQPRPDRPDTGDEADATSGLRTDAMPGTSEAAPKATGIRRPAFEGDPADPAAGDLPAAGLEVPVAERRTGESGPGSSAAAQGETPQPAVEQTQTGGSRQGTADERPVTGSHRPQSPSGEVAPS